MVLYAAVAIGEVNFNDANSSNEMHNVVCRAAGLSTDLNLKCGALFDTDILLEIIDKVFWR